MLGEGDLERQLTDARALLREATRSAVRVEREERVAEAAEGRIRVTLGADGRFSDIEIDPRLFREGSDYLAAEFRVAVNTALDGQDDGYPVGEPVPDLDAVNATVARLQDQSVRQMREMGTAISEVMRKIHRS